MGYKSVNMVDIKCPFFSSESEKSLNCEGVANSTRNSMHFDSKSKKNTYVDTYCSEYPNECPVAIGNMKKYDVYERKKT